MSYPYEEEDRKAALIQGLLGAAFPLFGAQKGREGNAFAQAGLLGLGQYNTSLRDATDARESQMMRRMREQQWQQQQAEYQRAQALQTKMDEAKQAATIPGRGAIPGGEAEPREGGMTPGLPAMPAGFDRQRYAQLLETIDPQKGLAYQQMLAKPQKELKDTRTLMQNGQRVTVNFYKDGSHEIVPYAPDAEKPHFVSTGGKVGVPLDPFTGRPIGDGVQATPTPDALLNDRRQRENNDIARGNATGTAADSLRKEFNALAPVQAFGKVLPALQAAREAMPQDNAAADLNLIYAAAKIFDPESVVRESETSMVAGAGSPAQRFVGQFNYVVGGGRLTPETRKQLMAQIEGRARGYEASYTAARKTYSTLAQKRGVDPADVFIEPTTTASAPLETPQDKRYSGGKIGQGATSETIPPAQSLPNGAIVTDTKTGRRMKVVNGRYQML